MQDEMRSTNTLLCVTTATGYCLRCDGAKVSRLAACNEVTAQAYLGVKAGVGRRGGGRVWGVGWRGGGGGGGKGSVA